MKQQTVTTQSQSTGSFIHSSLPQPQLAGKQGKWLWTQQLAATVDTQITQVSADPSAWVPANNFKKLQLFYHKQLLDKSSQ